MKITWPHLSKLDDRGLKMIFISYKLRSKAYRLYNLADGQVHVSHDIIFDENTFWSWDDDDTEVEYLIIEPGEGGAPDGAASPPAPSPPQTLAPSMRTPALAQRVVKTYFILTQDGRLC
jgi:hypothetical protein